MRSQRLRVFVSSRMQELQHEREAIRAALAEMHIDTFLFELDAGARPHSVEQTYLEEEEDADLYVGVFWKGYGPHTIAEFDHARAGDGLPDLREARQHGEARDAKLQEFLDQIGSADTGLVTIGRFDTIEQLRESIKENVARWQAALARHIRDTQSAIVHGVPSRPPADFVGRGAEIAQMVRALRSGRDVAIEGLPGIGKTTLAVALAHHPRVRRYFRDGVLWASLGPKADPLLNRGEMRVWLNDLPWPPIALPPADRAPERADFVAAQTLDIARRNAGGLLRIHAVRSLLDRLHDAEPTLVEAVERRFDPPVLTWILRGLLDDQVSVRDLHTVLESLMSVEGSRSSALALGDRITSRDVTFWSDWICDAFYSGRCAFSCSRMRAAADIERRGACPRGCGAVLSHCLCPHSAGQLLRPCCRKRSTARSRPTLVSDSVM